ncbi:hypothetical protein EDD21DRAFT_22586 [Dissophora ornata]|nr:hypothetical protein EDD21DRAFT_22586 [Dissophora ornata]
MASILFDDITFPRELYDPDTFEFVPPVSTLLAFTPHILSQLATTAENKQEPIPFQSPTDTASHDYKTSDTTPELAAERPTKPSSSSTGFFSTFQNVASSQGTQKILENGLYLAGRYMDGSSSSNRAAGASYGSSSSERDHSSRHRKQSTFWSGRQDCRDHERERLKEMEHRLELMEQQMRQSSATARSEIDEQRRERHKLEQELEAQKQKVKKMEAEIEEQAQKAEKKKESEEKKERTVAQRVKSKDTDEGSQEEASTKLEKSNVDGSSLTAANSMLMASVGVASLAMSLYAAHRASSTHSVVNFHDQLEQLMTQCDGVVQSTEAWISEQFLEVPDQIREDLKMIKELMETIQRLDPRSEKKIESVAWSMSAVGSLGAVGGAVLGSMTVMASGGTLIVGCALFGIVNRARYNGPEYKGARTMMELKAAQILKSLGVNPASSAASSTASGGTRASLIHDSRIERLRFEFEKRDGLDLRDADEIEGLVGEESPKGSFSVLFASPTASAMASRSRQESDGSVKEREDLRPTLRMKTELKKAFS